jgi:hypothetical protein
MPTLSFGGGKTDITDRPNRELGYIAIKSKPRITIDCTNVIATDSTPPGFAVTEVYNTDANITFINRPANGFFGRKYVLKLANSILQLNGVRYCPDLDCYDYTPYGYTNANPAYITIDLGSVLNVKELYVHALADIVALFISTDGSNYTMLAQQSGESRFFIVDQTLRYIRIRFTTTFTTTVYGYIYKVIITV